MAPIFLSDWDTVNLSALPTTVMSTLADELLNDFEDSGSEVEEEQENGIDQDGATAPAINGTAQDGSMVLDGDEEDVHEEDGHMNGDPVKGAVADADDEEEAKAKVEKMQLGGVSDVRNVAGLMKTLEPVLEVSSSYPTPQYNFDGVGVYIFHGHSPDALSSPPENCTSSESTARKTDVLCWLRRGQSRIPPSHTSKHALDLDRQRNHPRSQIHT